MTQHANCNLIESGFEIPLRGGGRAQVRPITPADQPAMVAAFDELSLETRAHRWLTPLSKLPSSMLKRLTHVDQQNHVAWGVGLPTAPVERGIGVGRFVRLDDEPQTAEFALTIVDAFQGERLGTFLLALLYRLAQHRRIEVLRGVIAPDHSQMLSWMSNLGARVYGSSEGLMHADLPVSAELNMPDTRSAGRFGRIFDRILAGEAETRTWNRS